MAEIEEVVNVSSELASDLAIKVGSIGKWLQAIGVIVVLWILIQGLNWFFNKRKLSKLNTIEERLESLETKTDRILKLQKKVV